MLDFNFNNSDNWKEIKDIKLLHKKNNSEVFLCKYKKEKIDEYIFLAKLDKKHHYYSDHPDNYTDLVFLLECGRQAETFLVHQEYNQEMNINFILEEWKCEFSKIFDQKMRVEGKDIFISVTPKNAHWLKERLTHQSYDMKFYYDSQLIAILHLKVKYTNRKIYQELRNRNRTSSLVYSDQCPPPIRKQKKINSDKIGRCNLENIVVDNIVRENETVRAKLAIDYRNIAFFDHIQDHYPAMTLVEAGKQISHLSTHFLKTKNTYNVSSIKCKFNNYAEFDENVNIQSRLNKNGDNKGKVEVFINFQQGTKKLPMQSLF